MQRKLLFSITKKSKDLRWDYYRGSGKGGQKRNKTSNCCRCTHIPSGAVGKAEEGRSQEQNRRRAFRRMAESDTFKRWVRITVARMSGDEREIKRKVENSLKKTKTEVRINGKWTEVDDCDISKEDK